MSDMNVASSLHTAHKPDPNSPISRAVKWKTPEHRRNGAEINIIKIAMMKNNVKGLPNHVYFSSSPCRQVSLLVSSFCFLFFFN